MRYVCLVHTEEPKLDSMPSREWDSLIEQHLEYDEVLRKSGHFLAGVPLEPAAAASLVRVREGQVSVTDAPSPRPRSSSAGSS